MAIVSCREAFRGRSLTGKFGETPTFTRVWLVSVDVADNDLGEISAAPAIPWLDPHPENTNAFLTDMQVQQESDSPFHYRVTGSYTGLVPEEAVILPWNRPVQYSFSGTLASAPCFWHYPNNNDNSTKKVIINTAGDPIGGLDRDEGEFSVTITQNVQSPFQYSQAVQYVGAINSDSWSGQAQKTCKCMSINANRKIEDLNGTQYVYYEVQSVIAYRDTGWDLQTWDVGFNELVNGQRKKIMAGSEPVSEPAALSSGKAKAPGQPPDLLYFRIYRMLPFIGAFPQLPTQ